MWEIEALQVSYHPSMAFEIFHSLWVDECELTRVFHTDFFFPSYFCANFLRWQRRHVGCMLCSKGTSVLYQMSNLWGIQVGSPSVSIICLCYAAELSCIHVLSCLEGGGMGTYEELRLNIKFLTQSRRNPMHMSTITLAFFSSSSPQYWPDPRSILQCYQKYGLQMEEMCGSHSQLFWGLQPIYFWCFWSRNVLRWWPKRCMKYLF